LTDKSKIEGLEMISFKKEITFKVGNITFGRNGGENPIVVFGSMFMMDHKIVSDHKKGIFDKKQARNEIEHFVDVARNLGLSPVIDVHAQTAEAMVKYIEFVADVTEYPIIIDGTIPDIRLPAAKLAKEIGINERTIYDSVSPDTRDEEIQKIREYGIDCIFVLLLNPANLRPEGRIEIMKKKLLPKIEKWDIKRPLLDTIVFDAPSSGMAAKAIELVKNEFGYPTGNGAPNAMDFIKEWHYPSETYYSVYTSILVLQQLGGADWIFAGPASAADYLLPPIALIDGVIAYSNKMMGHPVKMSKEHPLFKAMKYLQS